MASKTDLRVDSLQTETLFYQCALVPYSLIITNWRITMSTPLEISRLKELKPSNPFLQCELVEGRDPNETALEVPLFDFAGTKYQMGARLIWVPPDRAFARHIHPNAYHFIYVVQGTGIIEYDDQTYRLHPQECCL